MILLDRYIKIYRLQDIGNNKRTLTTLTTSIEATVQQLSNTKGGRSFGNNEKLFVIYMDVRLVNEGDELRDYDGNIYKVEAGGIEKRNDGFIADYLGVIVRKTN